MPHLLPPHCSQWDHLMASGDWPICHLVLPWWEERHSPKRGSYCGARVHGRPSVPGNLQHLHLHRCLQTLRLSQPLQRHRSTVSLQIHLTWGICSVQTFYCRRHGEAGLGYDYTRLDRDLLFFWLQRIFKSKYEGLMGQVCKSYQYSETTLTAVRGPFNSFQGLTKEVRDKSQFWSQNISKRQNWKDGK